MTASVEKQSPRLEAVLLGTHPVEGEGRQEVIYTGIEEQAHRGQGVFKIIQVPYSYTQPLRPRMRTTN